MLQALSPGSENALPERCADCGDEIDSFGARRLAVCGGTTLCFTCAVLRGGCWDSARHAWSVAPDYADLAEGYD